MTCGLLAINRPQDSFYSAIIGLVTLVIANFSFGEISLQSAAVSFLVATVANMTARLCFLILAYKKSMAKTDPQELQKM